MYDTLQLNWKLPNPLKPMASANLMNNNSSSSRTNNNNKRKAGLNQKTKTSGGRSKKNDDKYGLRACSIKKRIEVEGRKDQPKKRGPKPRPKPQPMSKYRRKTANLRERMRMGEINTAFEFLREKIPTPLATTKGRCEKLTKINILHVAINYIRALESILDTGDAGVQVYGTSIVRSPFDPVYIAESQTEQRLSNSKQNKSVKIAGASQRKKAASSSSSSSMSHYGSEDSGIVDEEMEQDNDDDDDDDEDDVDEDELEEEDEADVKVECPDWTELTSTLDFAASNFSEKSRPFPVKMPVRASMDTLLSTSSTLQQLNSSAQPINSPFNLAGEIETKRYVLQPIRSCNNIVVGNSIMAVNRQVSFTDLDGPDSSDLLGDLNALEDSLDDASFGGINFVHEDPFHIFI